LSRALGVGVLNNWVTEGLALGQGERIKQQQQQHEASVFSLPSSPSPRPDPTSAMPPPSALLFLVLDDQKWIFDILSPCEAWELCSFFGSKRM
jgi:hypothetical protein